MPGKKPVKEGDVLRLECTTQGKKGDGICKVSGFTIIVMGAKVGDLHDVKITKVGETFAFGQIVERV